MRELCMKCFNAKNPRMNKPIGATLFCSEIVASSA
jgi:hypothetical protein